MKVHIEMSLGELEALEKFIEYKENNPEPCMQCATAHDKEERKIMCIGCKKLKEWRDKHNELYSACKEAYENPHLKRLIERYREVVIEERHYNRQKAKLEAAEKAFNEELQNIQLL